MSSLHSIWPEPIVFVSIHLICSFIFKLRNSISLLTSIFHWINLKWFFLDENGLSPWVGTQWLLAWKTDKLPVLWIQKLKPTGQTNIEGLRLVLPFCLNEKCLVTWLEGCVWGKSQPWVLQCHTICGRQLLGALLPCWGKTEVAIFSYSLLERWRGTWLETQTFSVRKEEKLEGNRWK